MAKPTPFHVVVLALLLLWWLAPGAAVTQGQQFEKSAPTPANGHSLYLPVVADNPAQLLPTPTRTATPAAATPTRTAIPATATPAATPAATAIPATATPAGSTLLTAWIVSQQNSPIFTDATVNVQQVTAKTVNGTAYVCITTDKIPDYVHTTTASDIAWLNSRPKAATDFRSGQTTLSAGSQVLFGADIGYRSLGCAQTDKGYGYWPPGPKCPTAQNAERCFPLQPTPASTSCKTGLGDIGAWVNGVAVFNWGDGFSYNNQSVWQNIAAALEAYDLDICVGHSAGGNYHHHFHPSCLADQLGDDGSAHSPLYGFAADGYPIYGPWQAANTLAQSCWHTRNYDDPASNSGCGSAGRRTCLLVDETDLSKGTVAASSAGPTTAQSVTSLSGNLFTARSGIYRQDYYYDASCTAAGGATLDLHNGHSHDALGYHYHVTVTRAANGDLVPAFPYYIGPTYAGTLPAQSFASCGGNQSGPPGPPPRPAESTHPPTHE